VSLVAPLCRAPHRRRPSTHLITKPKKKKWKIHPCAIRTIRKSAMVTLNRPPRNRQAYNERRAKKGPGDGLRGLVGELKGVVGRKGVRR
jgi:hypothetical protein